MVRGFAIAVTAVALMYQCAEMTRMARGRGTAAPNARHAAVYRLSSSAFIGFPWPRNAAGMRGDGSTRRSVRPLGPAPDPSASPRPVEKVEVYGSTLV